MTTRQARGSTLSSSDPLAVDPRDAGVLYAAWSGGVSCSAGGGSWQPVALGLVPGQALTLAPGAGPKLYAGTLASGPFVRRLNGAPE
jgi:hypothetical protein